MNWTDLPFFTSETYEQIANRLAEDMNAGKNVLPMVSNIMRALDTTPFDQVKVCILGQDPYPTKGHANGLAFSVDKNVSPLPKSLQNIYKELYTDVGVIRSSGDLTDWATQGVLLLNTSLTVIEGETGSHSNIGWSRLSDEVIKALSEHREHIVFMLWGKQAQAKEYMIDKTKHCVIKTAHPSPLSAYRGFFNSKPFSKTNAYLRQHEIAPIDWSEK
jgi:uracil-DNA glycosylase